MALALRASLLLLFISSGAYAQLSLTFYATTCPILSAVVLASMTQAVLQDHRMGASMLQMFFHDCFVNGCDASVLLDDTANFTGEKNAFANVNLHGFEVIDAIKARVETLCPGVVSCADILALAARDGTVLLGGPAWLVPLGRRDARTASKNDANNNLPGPSVSLSNLIEAFGKKGLTARDMTALSGCHTIGQARCITFKNRLSNDANIDPAFVSSLRPNCPTTGGDGNLSPLDVQTPNRFDNAYYKNLLLRRGLLHSDQELFNNGTQDALVQSYASNPLLFAIDFAVAMVKMGNISPLTGKQGEIRGNCRRIN